jgi:hypothetical protein
VDDLRRLVEDGSVERERRVNVNRAVPFRGTRLEHMASGADRSFASVVAG